MKITPNQTLKFYKRKTLIPNTILSVTERHETIHGGRAVNAQIPLFLRRKTNDYDIFTRIPKKDAKQTERVLDKRFGGNYFYTEPAEHKGTIKVKSYITGETYADYTKPDRKLQRKKIGGIYYVSLGFMQGQAKRALKNKEAKFRHAKDRDMLNRIIIKQKGLWK